VFDVVEHLRAAILARVGVPEPYVTLPDEVWGLVWSFLPQRDRFTVSHVSRRWRSMCLNTPSLWNEVDYISSTHRRACVCDACLHDERDPQCSGCGRRISDETDNLEATKAIISRSGKLLLDVNIHLAGNADSDSIADLLRNVNHRIRSLHLSLDRAESAPDFFTYFEVFPKLHQLTVFTRDIRDATTSTKVFHDKLYLPALRRLELDGLYQISTSIPQPLPVLSVRHVIHDISDFACVLITCTKARHIHWCIKDLVSSADLPEALMTDLSSSARMALSAILPETVIVEQITDEDLGTVLDFVHVPDLPNLALSFYDNCFSNDRSFDILTDVQGATAIFWDIIDFSTKRMRLVIVGSVMRSIEHLEHDLNYIDSLWETITSLSMLKHISADASLWEFVFANMPNAPLLSEINVTFEPIHDVSRALAAIGTVWKHSPQLNIAQFKFVHGWDSEDPNMQYEDADTTRRFALEVVSFAEAFHQPMGFEKLETLRISGYALLLPHELASLKKLANNIKSHTSRF